MAAADSKVASRFAYDVLVNEGEAAGAKGAGVKRGKDGHVQLASGDDFFSAPLSNSGQKASGRWAAPMDSCMRMGSQLDVSLCLTQTHREAQPQLACKHMEGAF